MSRQDERAADRARRQAAQVDTSDTARASVGSGSRARVPLPQFLREVRGELRRVAWPSRPEVINFSITVLVVTAVLTALVWGMDEFLRELALVVFS
jgi:preprotein translocase subunit SecE